MSRIGKKPIELTDGAQACVADATVTIKGPKGERAHVLPKGISAEVDAGKLIVKRSKETAQQKALHGLSRSLLQGIVTGLTKGFRKELQILGIGYRGQCRGQRVILNLGYSHSVEFSAPEGISISMPEPTKIIIEGTDKQLVGQIAANIRSFRAPDVYKGKGIRYVGEQITLKEGKTVA